MAADTISPQAFDWSITHVRKYGDTDIFPIPFEYDAIAHDWSAVRAHLNAIDFSNIKVRPDRRVLVLKPGGGFRAAVQLDPIDHLVYTSATFEAADAIEAARIPVDQRIACSYRVQLTPEGAFFSTDNGWRDFQERSRELASGGSYSHVLLADIADFYNQLGQHRIQNALESANVAFGRTKSFEFFLNQVTAKQSQGIPVGPIGSILIAEACLIDVDNFLLRLGIPFTRYVDDFRIFCKSRRDAINTRHSLADYLFSVHRLSLESGKTRILFVDKFISEELPDAEEQERDALLAKINGIFQSMQENIGWYSFEEIQLDEKEHEELLSQAEQESFVELFERCVTNRPLNLGLARYMLRKAMRGRTVILNDLVFKNLEVLAPVMRDVVRYVRVTIPKKAARARGGELLTFAASSDIADLPFVQMWIAELIRQRPDLCEPPVGMDYAETIGKNLGYRPSALIAAAYHQIDWVRSKKETWRNYQPWDRRALIWSTSILATGEKRPFLNMVAEQGDVLDAAVAKYLLSM